MVKKYSFGVPFNTEAVTEEISVTDGKLEKGNITIDKGFCFEYELDKNDRVYGLGEANRGINKRGYIYVSNCTDDDMHSEDKVSLYGAHNFIIIAGKENIGLFFDNPGNVCFDIGYTKRDVLSVTGKYADMYVYVITGENTYDIVKQFRRIIGRSYIPPKFAFGFGQSRWGYKTPEDLRNVMRKHREAQVPLDMIYMDIDYMDSYKDFTVNTETFEDIAGFVKEMRNEDIHLVPIIDAGVKIEEGYDVYDEGVANGYFCKREDGSYFEAAVWPGLTHYPDVLNADARRWFGDKYKVLTDAGIDAFWNDMNEPAIFYTPELLAELKGKMQNWLENWENVKTFEMGGEVNALSNNPRDYERFYHETPQGRIRHDRVHNLYGYNMTRAAGEAFERIVPGKRVLMFSRSSYIGMHRYGGIWTGDNRSWWSHLLLNIKMMPSLNMCGFLYSGADIGGFGSNTSRDLLLRWLAFGVFTPLMRNHSALGTREQEFYQFEDPEDFKAVISTRYRLIPYLYSTYMKAALNNDMYFRPLAFEYPDDEVAVDIEDQLMLGDEVMLAPVYTQNVRGRAVYLPEEMIFVKFLPDDKISQQTMSAGWNYIQVELNEVPLFIRNLKCIPVVASAQSVNKIDMSTLEYIGYPGADYDLYDDDGETSL